MVRLVYCQYMSVTVQVYMEIICSDGGAILCGAPGKDGQPLGPMVRIRGGLRSPVWDIADKFGDTNLLVTNMAQARDLATCLGGNNVALMRGHGFAAAAGRAALGLPAAQRAGIDARAAAGRRDQVLVAGRDRGPQPRLQPLFGRNLAKLGILGEQGRLRPPAHSARKRGCAN